MSTRFLRLNHKFWNDGWDSRLSLPATAMLLVALSEEPGFALPTDRVPEWYGWSADTAERGFAELHKEGLLAIRKEQVTAPLSPTGLAVRNRYTVLPPFDAASVDSDAAGLRRRSR